MPQVDTEVRGVDVTLLRIRALRDELAQRVKDALSEAINAAEAEMRVAVPKDSGRLASTIRKGGIIYAPGGLGGGGAYEIELTVGEGVHYLNVLVEGSGLWGQRHAPIVASRGNIQTKLRPEWLPTKGAHVMKFTPKGSAHPIYRVAVRGQHGQDEWIALAQAAANAVITERLAAIGAEGHA